MSTKDDTLPEFMKGVTCCAPKDYRYSTDKAMPVCGADDIIVKVGACGICAGDAKCYAGAMMFWGDEAEGGRRKPYVQAPVTPGHEFVGKIVAMGENAIRAEEAKSTGGFKIGDYAISEQIVACGSCLYCIKGLRWLCQPHDIYGFHTCTQGGMAEYMKYPVKSINYQLPKGHSWEHLAFVEPLSCAVHGVERAAVQFGDTIVVSGCGPIGLGMVAAAKAKSPGRVIALDMMDSRLDIARDCGADIVINPSKEDAVQKVLDICGGYGCDVYMEATGHPSSVEQGLMMTRKMGNFVEFSVFGKKTEVDWTIIGDTKELNILGGHLSGLNGYEQAIKMIASGKLPMDSLITHQFSFQDFQKGIDQVNDGRGSIKVVLTPGE
jgi:threonine dehydrogenase-like Zn-dependent dehydrogenase